MFFRIHRTVSTGQYMVLYALTLCLTVQKLSKERIFRIRSCSLFLWGLDTVIQSLSSLGNPIFSTCLDRVVRPGKRCQKRYSLFSPRDQVLQNTSCCLFLYWRDPLFQGPLRCGTHISSTCLDGDVWGQKIVKQHRTVITYRPDCSKSVLHIFLLERYFDTRSFKPWYSHCIEVSWRWCIDASGQKVLPVKVMLAEIRGCYSLKELSKIYLKFV